MKCPVLRWPLNPECPKCEKGDEDIHITDLAVERIGILVVTVFCDTCKWAYSIPYSIHRVLYEAEMEDERVSSPVPKGTWTAHPKPGKPN
jgi:hypothetical protein